MTKMPKQLASNPTSAAGSRLETISRLLLLSSIFLVFGAIAWQAVLSFPSADDFCFGYDAIRKGIAQTTVDLYMNWTGRYTSNYIIAWSSASKTILTADYFIFPALIIAANILALGYAIRQIGINSKIFAFVMAVILISGYSLRETVFWLSGGITYGLGCALFVTMIGAEYTLFTRSVSKPRTGMLVCSVSAILLAGFNETIMVAHVALLSLLVLTCLICKKDAVAPLSFILASATIGACIVALAPGNSIRETAESFGHAPLLAALAKSFAWLLYQHLNFGLTIVLVVYSALIVLAPKVNTEANPRMSWYFAAFLCIAAWAGIFTRYYVIGDYGPVRTRTVDTAIIFVMCLIIAVNLYLATNRIIRGFLKVAPQLILFVVVAFLVAVLGQPVPDSGSLRASLSAARYAYPLKKYIEDRFVKINAIHDGGPALVADYPDKKQALTFFADIGPDPEHWRNKCFSGYFGLKEVRLDFLQQKK